MKNKNLEDIVLHCGDCKHYKMNTFGENKYSSCIRLNGDLYMKPLLFVPSSGHSMNKIICKDFEPNDNFPWLKKVWTTYDDYEVEHYSISFLVIGKKSDDERWYRIHEKDFIEGNMDKLEPYYLKRKNGYKDWIKNKNF